MKGEEKPYLSNRKRKTREENREENGKEQVEEGKEKVLTEQE